MAQRLIDANALYMDLVKMKDFGELTAKKAIREVEKAPTIDAEPVRHGKWELAEDGWYCSACKLYPPFDCDPEEKGIPYCPNCGADMRGEEEWTK